MGDTHLSVIIPAFNEESRISETLAEIMVFLKKQPYPAEILVCDDGSRDGTVAVARERLGDFPHRILRSEKNRGKGDAVKRGMLAASGTFLLFSDADLSTPITEVTGFLESLESGYDVVIGSRALDNSNIEVHQERHREWMGKIFNRIARLFTFKGIRDSQCGFKCFKRDVARDLFSLQRMEGFSFDVEIVYLAQRRGYRIREAPVTWRHSAATRVSLLSDPFRMFLDVLRIRWIHRNL
ncbi:MAG: glycosyltransferase family 2 protein [Candidatus Omnitrophota bacterium]|nr:glycosyltransferase family 2 protein [Candidatus Omnitrophota bacterium]